MNDPLAVPPSSNTTPSIVQITGAATTAELKKNRTAAIIFFMIFPCISYRLILLLGHTNCIIRIGQIYVLLTVMLPVGQPQPCPDSPIVADSISQGLQAKNHLEIKFYFFLLATEPHESKPNRRGSFENGEWGSLKST